MYKVSVPVMNSNFKRSGVEKTVEELKKFNAERVFLALDKYETDNTKRKAVMNELKENCKILKSYGFEVGAWIWTFWITDNSEFGNMRSIKGTEIKEFKCPTDRKFVEFACGYIKDIANCGVDLIMFDDDFRYGNLGDSPACLCDNHLAEINRITGRNSTVKELYKYITTGGKNKYRDAYLKSNGEAFKKFAAAVRNAADEVNSEIRIGACSCISSWNSDGIDPKELAYILAGNTKPFIRLIGAPYWAVSNAWGNALQDVVELERMESSWIGDNGIEIMAEGDAFPRPRTNCPANYLEGFDTAIRVSGCTDGILKYGMDYYSNADYETGYAKHHMYNSYLYKDIENIFGEKTSVGVRVYSAMNKLSDMVNPTNINSDINIENLLFFSSARTMAYNTIPTVYEGDGVCGIVFDEDARKIPLECLKKGLILDITAAEILRERGVDVGIEMIDGVLEREKSEHMVSGNICEHFIYNNNHISVGNTKIYDIKLKDAAEVLSDIEVANGTVPMSYRYENSDGNRFLVLNINTRGERSNLLYNYERSRQYAENIPWLSGEKLPAYIYGNPALYIQCKKDQNAMAVGLWNFCADNVFDPEVKLDKEYNHIKFFNCNGRLDGNTVYLSDIAPYGFAAFEVN